VAVKVVGSKQKLDAANLDYSIDWSAWLETDTISDSVWTIEPPDELTQTDGTHSTTGATIWLNGGKAGTKYLVTNKVTTVGGRIDERAFQLTVY
jgi:hypothetical protein